MATSPGNNNTYVPSLEATGQLQIDFSRNPDSFALNKYVKIINVDKREGHYLSFNSEEGARITNVALDKYRWQDGSMAPDNLVEKEHSFPVYKTERYIYPYTVGNIALDQAEWDVLSSFAQTSAAKAMTAREVKTVAQMETGSNWTGFTATATSAAGGKWDVSGSNDLFIKKSLSSGLESIHQSTNGVVGSQDVLLVINPNTARQMSEGGDGTDSEIHSYLSGSPFSLDAIGERKALQNWGLPTHLYGLEVVIDDAVIVTNKQNATRADSYVITNTNAWLVSRPGGLSGDNGSTLSSTICLFMAEDLSVESMDDPDNRRVKGRVVDDFQPIITSSASGYFFTAVVD